MVRDNQLGDKGLIACALTDSASTEQATLICSQTGKGATAPIPHCLMKNKSIRNVATTGVFSLIF